MTRLFAFAGLMISLLVCGCARSYNTNSTAYHNRAYSSYRTSSTRHHEHHSHRSDGGSHHHHHRDADHDKGRH